MRTSLPVSLFLLGFALAGAQVVAHTSTSEGLVSTNIQGITIPPISGAPFTAKVVVKWDEPLTGGGTISREYYTKVARDAQGRVRRENRGFVPANSTITPPLRSIIITDPVAATRTTCTPSSMTCTTVEFHPRVALAGDPATDGAGGPISVAGGKISRVSLGEETMQQLRVVGTRETANASAGDNGSSRAVASSRDIWYSPDLQIDMSVIRNSPQMGQITLTVTELVRGDPDPARFAAPSGYTTRGGSR